MSFNFRLNEVTSGQIILHWTGQMEQFENRLTTEFGIVTGTQGMYNFKVIAWISRSTFFGSIVSQDFHPSTPRSPNHAPKTS